MENKISKYLKYAIGEIILVVIGILIALHINNWNEQRKSDALYYSYLLRLKEDFTSIHNSTTDALETEERLINLGKLVLDFSLNKKEKVNPLELAVGIDFTAGRYFYNRSSQTWKDLVSTGNLKLIENKQLRNDIGAYNNLANQRDFQIEEWFRFKEQYRDLTRHILKPEERLLIPDSWPNTNVSESDFDDLRSIFNSSLDEIKFKLQEIPELNGVLSDVIITREITTHMMHGELKILNGILEIIEFEISKFEY